MTVTAPAASPEHLNELMIDAIAAARPVGTSDPRVLDAIRAVPRHAFVPGASLADAYNPELAVITKRDTGGEIAVVRLGPLSRRCHARATRRRRRPPCIRGRSGDWMERRAARYPRRARRARHDHRH